MNYNIINSKSKTFIAFCFSFLIGVVIASIFKFNFDYVVWGFVFVILIGLLVAFRKSKSKVFIFVNVLLIILGICRYNFALPNDNEKYISHYNGNKFKFVGYISTEPDVRIVDIRYVVQSDDLKGKVYFKSTLYPRYDYGDRVEIECDLVTPEAFDDFRYDMYLANMGVFSLCVNPYVSRLDGYGGSIFFREIMKYKNIFAGQINKLWHEPYASFMAGLLYGYRGGLGDLQEHFNRTGITHIVAISGYNISIISIMLITIFVRLWIPRKKAFWIIIFCIFLFVIFAGASGSVVRAGIMGSIVLLSKYLGRKNRMANTIIFTAVLMTIYNPFVLVWDIGFQLSFLATIGLVYLLPILEDKFKKFPNLFSIKTLFLSTISAIILTFPLTLYQFGRFSIVAPVVNILVLWLIPFIMLFGFISVLLSFLFYPIGQMFAWLTFLGLKYITFITVWFSTFEYSSVEFQVPLFFIFVIYFVIFFIIYKLKK
ncbi:MAG: hypothetical protein A2725_03610 [Candidatus Magasanikbacteria bacterium RIFCSPHIGHO2_01_FULL_33_34]|uniref:ComEC/Rec2-related protein domain-containing protein n=1 Tax=Candidatus Magasanikbacteria bacterium RIFCSPHIGHO2_01_FULL_33_34 TaxID=1798671 RepID=A0A1F6LH91_9BACT|nr:MAG: hypothetical protein A2725_03610 [Candidatus Magasanikbacteria bacterium RIFCSPHIGHO2_01_FULL_33_34]OGH65058.1 MAG: hypothetical protein A3B83_03370 [Candidatus Magasanikbacteria bacterium RIFCSPHIGHO2_02_FULL_33_17]OGH75398.1 MAG: hypothetical protein A3A89_04795 [Candidatus Magasanikbacteria bacterium RIFCSPLOWO2_01_FULL_33_34]OGH81457.1 MAG: hypothetical protein A3F93_02585 [Candidatus Magasanikbacteria bacterium RIFCSPLOWO2_12_FULL_34_7]